jgi:transmembrane sensor
MKALFGQQRELSVGEEAARWLCELRDGDREQQTQFFMWLRRSPRHVEEFLFATTMWRKLERFGQSDPARIERLIAAAQAAERDTSSVAQLPISSEEPAQKGSRATRTWMPRVAAAILVIAVASSIWFFSMRSLSYETAVGEQRIVRLSDGSRVELNTRSQIAVRFSKHARDIRLIDGEALFTVAKDPVRPFRVDSGDTTIQAVGTQFNVYRHSQGTKVAVLEGVVRIEDGPVAIKLAAGEAAQIQSNGQMIRHKPESIDDEVVWRQQRLVFRADRLEDVVAEVNRYTPRAIRVEGDARSVRLTAVFDADDPDSLIRFLTQMPGLSVENDGSGTVIRARPAQSSL